MKIDIDYAGEVDLWLADVFDGKRHHRCDACTAQAFVAFVRLNDENEQVFLFCGHHASKHGVILEEQGWDEISARHVINDKPSASSGTATEDGE